MDVGTLSIRDIFGQDRRHVVPLFQRPYLWERNTHWEPLWEDIQTIADRLLTGQPARPHFLGAIVVDQQRKPTGHLETRLVIDGQQRLTTIQLLLEAFADLCARPDTENHHRALLKLTRNDDPLSQDPDEQFKVWPTNEDRDHFRRVMRAGSAEELYRAYAKTARSKLRRPSMTQADFAIGTMVNVISGRYAGQTGKVVNTRGDQRLLVEIGDRTRSIRVRRLELLNPPPGWASPEFALDRSQRTAPGVGHPIADAYLYFSAAVSDWIGLGKTGVEGRVGALYTALRDYLRMVVIDLGPDDDAQVIFETLNARGARLLPSDLVKNFLFHLAQLQGQNIEALYRQYWRPFDDEASYWRQNLGRGHARRARIDTFLQHYLTLRIGDEVPVDHLYTSFRSWVDDSNGNASVQLKDLRRYAEIYQSFDQIAPENPDSLFFERLALMETTTAYPFLLELFVGYSDDEGTIRSVLRDLESFLVRRMVCQLNTRGYNRLFVELLGALRAEGGVPASRVRGYLLSSHSESNRWPKDVEFREAWLDTPLYRLLVRKRVRMLLEALERRLRTGKSEKIQFREKLTIEHLLPQEWRKHWPLPSGLPIEEAEKRRERALHTIGNLTLLTKRLNPSVSNGPWERKRAEIPRFSVAVLNAHLSEVWDEGTIRQRSQSLFDQAKQNWPRPENR